MMSALLGLNFLFGVKTTTFMDLGIILMFYGLYFGVCGRDVAHVCTEHLACRIGVRFFFVYCCSLIGA